MHAKVNGDVIYCAKKAIKLDDTHNLAIGDALINSNCQRCSFFEPCGEMIPKKERGWINGAMPKQERLCSVKDIKPREIYKTKSESATTAGLSHGY
jgi:hypothetical protein